MGGVDGVSKRKLVAGKVRGEDIEWITRSSVRVVHGITLLEYRNH